MKNTTNLAEKEIREHQQELENEKFIQKRQDERLEKNYYIICASSDNSPSCHIAGGYTLNIAKQQLGKLKMKYTSCYIGYKKIDDNGNVGYVKMIVG